MIRLILYLTIFVDFGLLFLNRGLRLIYGLTDENNVSATSFEKYKTLLAPTRDGYLVLTVILNFLVIGVLIINNLRQKGEKKLGTIEKLALFASISTLLILSFIKIVVPNGRLI